MRWAVPSFVIPGTVAENISFLKEKVTDISLCFFESRGCLDYTDSDIPEKNDSGLRYSMHLPVDLDWESPEPEETARMAIAVYQKGKSLSPAPVILHPPLLPPEKAAQRLKIFLSIWQKHTDCRVLLENIPGAPLSDLPAALFSKSGYGVCLDAGHLMGYHQNDLLESPVLTQVEMIHWSAPGDGDRHLPLDRLTPLQHRTALKILQRTPAEAVQLLEIFRWQGIETSIPVLKALWQQTHGNNTARNSSHEQTKSEP